MLKRILTFLLAAGLVLSLCPVAMAIDEELEDKIAGAYDSFTASIYQNKADSEAIDQFLDAALYGKGQSISFGPQDGVSAAIYQSELFRTFFISAIKYAIDYMDLHGLDFVMTGGDVNWYDFGLIYNVMIYPDRDIYPVKFKEAYRSPYQNIHLSVPGNQYDDALALVVGAAEVRIRIQRTQTTADTVTYGLDVYVLDGFDFENDYSVFEDGGYDTSMSQLITTLGPLLGLKSFDWLSRTQLTLTLSNTCDHTGSGVYRWENRNEELVNEENPARKRSLSGGNFFYELTEPMYLYHDAPWSVEFRLSGSCDLYLGPMRWFDYTAEAALSMLHGRVEAFTVSRNLEVNPAHGFQEYFSSYEFYGTNYKAAGYSDEEPHTYRIENRVAADGSNGLWLLIDGAEVGCLADHRVRDTFRWTITEDGSDSTWVSGRDFVINCIFNEDFPGRPGMALEYLQVDTGAEYIGTGHVGATCTVPGGSVILCRLCGLVTKTLGESVLLPHTPKVTEGYAATCEEAGLSDGSVCAECGTVLAAQEVIPPLPHNEVKLYGFAAGCTTPGLSEGTMCRDCAKILVPQQTLLPLGHSYQGGKCNNCGQADPNAQFVQGDADGDGDVTYMDAMQALQMAVGLLDANLVCDMDGDNTVTYLDAMQILRLAVGLS